LPRPVADCLNAGLSPTVAYIVESWSEHDGLRVVGWFVDFKHAMSVAATFSAAHVRAVELDEKPRSARGTGSRGGRSR
jgi:hypothetical protein